MDDARFDALTKTLSIGHTRRGLTRLLGGLSLGGMLSVLGTTQALAAKRNGGAPCTRNGQCKTGRCLRNNTCSCSSEFPTCKQPTDPCKTAVCNLETRRCVNRNICRQASCTNGVATKEATCDGTGTCPGLVTEDCAPYTCNPATNACRQSCGGDPAECASTHFCEGGQCKPKKDLGESCANALECSSGFCAPGDHVCCNSACDATGQTCGDGTNCTCPPGQSVCGFACQPTC